MAWPTISGDPGSIDCVKIAGAGAIAKPRESVHTKQRFGVAGIVFFRREIKARPTRLTLLAPATSVANANTLIETLQEMQGEFVRIEVPDLSVDISNIMVVGSSAADDRQPQPIGVSTPGPVASPVFMIRWVMEVYDPNLP